MSMKKAVLIAALMFFLTPANSFSSDGGEDGEREYRFFHGIISGYSGNSIIVNEGKKANITYETKFFDSSGREVEAYRLPEHRWVYVEGTTNRDGSVDAEKIYLLPGPVSGKNKTAYGFIQSP